MTAGLDTSVVLRLLIGEPAAQAAAAKRWLQETVQTSGEPVQLADLVVGESYFALRHHYGVPHGEALHALQLLAADRRIAVDAASNAVLQDPQAASAHPGFMNRLIQQRYRTGGLAMVTFDKRAARLPGVTLLRQGKA